LFYHTDDQPFCSTVLLFHRVLPAFSLRLCLLKVLHHGRTAFAWTGGWTSAGAETVVSRTGVRFPVTQLTVRSSDGFVLDGTFNISQYSPPRCGFLLFCHPVTWTNCLFLLWFCGLCHAWSCLYSLFFVPCPSLLPITDSREGFCSFGLLPVLSAGALSRAICCAVCCAAFLFLFAACLCALLVRFSVLFYVFMVFYSLVFAVAPQHLSPVPSSLRCGWVWLL